DYSNGYYLMWALDEPPYLDFQSEKVLAVYSRLADTNFMATNAGSAKEWIKKNKEMYSGYTLKYTELRLELSPVTDTCQAVLKAKEKLQSPGSDLELFYSRYQTLVDAPVFESFATTEGNLPIPNLLSCLNAARLYTAVNVLTALEGDWETGVRNLLKQVDFGKRGTKGSRVLITNLILKANTHIALDGLMSLMNRKECPTNIFRMILNGMPDISYEEYGARNGIICEALTFDSFLENRDEFDVGFQPLGFWNVVAVKYLLQKENTINLANEVFAQWLNRDKTPPYKWESALSEPKTHADGPGWWFSNAGGKIMLDNYLMSRDGVLYKTYQRKSIYDMVRISAELHLNYTPDKSIPEILEGLTTYKSLMDPCSGKPYKWNDEKQLLYGIGVDREDNKGDTKRYAQLKGSDYAVPVILYLKEAKTQINE
ncbi:MAG: hypothetical protein GY765_34870, partial [bacterium]|nr:hypothetical protein [bacterium]